MGSYKRGVAEMDPGSESMEAISKTLFTESMMGNWSKVVEIYATCPSARKAKITHAEDTVLHVAISEATPSVVRQLVEALPDDDRASTLALENEDGNTPLHLAAGLGLAEVCALLVEKAPELVVEARNTDKETPQFMAAKHGKKMAFFTLQNAITKQMEGDGVSYCRRSDGNTILHVAVSGEYFDLAFEIIHLYPKLINFNNARGQTALHLLANNPLAFRSGSRMRSLDSLIYACIIVDPLKLKYPAVRGKVQFKELRSEERRNMFPENYQTCTDMFSLVIHVYKLIVACFRHRSRMTCFIARDMKKDEERGAPGDQENQEETENEEAYHKSEGKSRLPENYTTCFRSFKIAIKVLMVILGIGIRRVDKIKRKKQKHSQANQLMDELVNGASRWEYDENGRNPNKSSAMNGPLAGDDFQPPTGDDLQPPAKNEPDADTPVLVAAKRGVTEIVKKVLDNFPVAVQDLDSDKKNIVLLAVEHRQPHVYNLMLKRNKMKESTFGMVDKDGNSALHLAATLGHSRPWVIPGAALQMQWEIKWYKFVKNSMEPNFFPRCNDKGQTARQLFTETHEPLVKEGGTWLTSTSESCSVVAALIATVAFASATTVPGGINSNTGFPTFAGQPAFAAFAISALVALCFSVTSLVMFLSILTSRYQERDFENGLPTKLILGLTALFMSIAAMLVSFCAGHFYVMEEKLKYAAFPIYAVTCLPVTFFAVAQFPLYIDLIKALVAKVPERTYKSPTF